MQPKTMLYKPVKLSFMVTECFDIFTSRVTIQDRCRHDKQKGDISSFMVPYIRKRWNEWSPKWLHLILFWIPLITGMSQRPKSRSDSRTWSKCKHVFRNLFRPFYFFIRPSFVQIKEHFRFHSISDGLLTKGYFSKE